MRRAPAHPCSVPRGPAGRSADPPADALMRNLEVRADAASNRLYVTMSGFADDAQMESFIGQVLAELPKLRPGFAMISTIADFKATTPAGAKALENAMQAYKRH